MRRALAWLVVLVAAVAAVTACSSSAGDDDAQLTDQYGLTQAGAKQALLTDSEVGSGLAVLGGNAPETPAPCERGSGSVASGFTPRAHAVIRYADSEDVSEFTEVVDNYSGTATTAQVIQAYQSGLTCKGGYIGRIAVTISGPQAVSVPTPTDNIAVWTISGAGARQSIIVASMGTQVIQLIFGASGAEQADVDASGIAERALAKVRATLAG